MDVIAKAANSIAESDILSNTIRKNNEWALMPNAGFLGTIYPTQQMKGSFKSQIHFTQYLGKFSVILNQSLLFIRVQIRAKDN